MDVIMFIYNITWSTDILYIPTLPPKTDFNSKISATIYSHHSSVITVNSSVFPGKWIVY